MIIKRRNKIKDNKATPEAQAVGQFIEEKKADIAIDAESEVIPAEEIIQPVIEPIVQEPIVQPKDELSEKLEEIEKIDISSIEFKERFERRRGERRRGYRRIDERSLVSRAQEEAASIRELAAKEGYKNGIEEAQEELEKLKNSLCEFLSSRRQIYDEMSSSILEISLEVAKKIIKKEIELSDDILKGVMGEVFDEISTNEEKITVKVYPDEVDFARASLPEILENSQVDAKIFIIADENIEKGSCVVITNNGVIDANFSTQLQIIQNAFGIYKGGI